MSKLRRYDIAFRGLKQGSYELDFEIDQELIDEFDGPSQGILAAKGEAKVKLAVQSSSMAFDFEIDAELTLSCDICLEAYQHNLYHQEKLFVKLGELSDDQQDDVIIVGADVQVLNVAQFIYEYINYGLPIKRTHPLDAAGEPTCNPEMLNFLEAHAVHQDEEDSDPRWEALRKLKEN